MLYLVKFENVIGSGASLPSLSTAVLCFGSSCKASKCTPSGRAWSYRAHQPCCKCCMAINSTMLLALISTYCFIACVHEAHMPLHYMAMGSSDICLLYICSITAMQDTLRCAARLPPFQLFDCDSNRLVYSNQSSPARYTKRVSQVLCLPNSSVCGSNKFEHHLGQNLQP